ncbi:endonuclease VII domain-containing protein [Blastococcus sp. BMG 814]|uniref:Endonuclease VII domain-containing protein n=1 Tax=Blastococcus carthaginiensis TaxID=3050034 RepID=A0ABT9ICL0_9ACTN|nr:endonuclease VII domain-containing protein [Blastococcus carthaginiensis]MDP5183311.1 endonuclease VII domain-containing protein [Blastococcus carthaginiensis]
MVDEKFCRDCGELRPVAEFSRDRRRADGLSFYCKVHARRRLLASKDARQGPPKRRHRREVDVPEGAKWCPDCEVVKPVDDFVRNAGQPSGRAPYCKPCHNARGKRSMEKLGGSRTYHLKRRYGITAAEADAMLEEQNGVCAICRTAPAQHVDHDHATGAVRALLCFNCNGGLGQFRDDPWLLRMAAFYVEHHMQQQAIAVLQAAGADDPDGQADVSGRR